MDYPETQIWKKILSSDCDTRQLAYFDDDEVLCACHCDQVYIVSNKMQKF